METGIVKFFKQDSGYGFITNDETGEDIFVHANGCLYQNVKQNDKVTYEVGKGKKGPMAIEVQKVK